MDQTSFIAANVSHFPSRNSTSINSSYLSNESLSGESRLSVYSNDAPSRSKDSPLELEIEPLARSTEEIRDVVPLLAGTSPDIPSHPNKTRDWLSRHRLIMRNASVHDMQFIMITFLSGHTSAMRHYKWRMNLLFHSKEELLAVADKPINFGSRSSRTRRLQINFLLDSSSSFPRFVKSLD